MLCRRIGESDSRSNDYTSSKRARYDNYLPSPEMAPKPKKRRILEVGSSLEMILYDDVMYHICSLLLYEDQSRMMGVSRRFAKNAEDARNNKKTLWIECASRQEDYVNSVLKHCRKINAVHFRKGMTLPLEGIKAIISSGAKTIEHVLINFNPACIGDLIEDPSKYPIKCDTFFLSFLAKTIRNLLGIIYIGCIQEKDFQEFAQSCTSLRIALFRPRRYVWHDGANRQVFLDGMKTILEQNHRHLKWVAVSHINGFGEVLLNAPELPALTRLDITFSNISPDTKRKIVEKFTHVEKFVFKESSK